LVTYTNQKSAGANQNYYWDNGTAQLSGFSLTKPGDYRFSGDAQGRSGVAQALLTYQEFQDSKGSRQGTPLDPPFWPKNVKVAIDFGLTGKTYHGYLYNRSHSVADSLLGAGSYTSKFNFTTGTRSQNVGADQNGGMRAAEELAENFWKTHPGSKATISYQTTPLYQGSETVPRGSIVDEKSSDGSLNKEIVVINSAEGISINYQTGAAS
jgi:DNA-entry nuclease